MTKLQTKASHYGAQWQTEMTTRCNRPTKAMLKEAKFLRRERRDTEVRIITDELIFYLDTQEGQTWLSS